MYELTVIEQKEVLGQQLRIYGDFENPLFLARDVAKRIGHTDAPAMLKSIDCDERIKARIPPDYCSGGIQPNTEYWFLTEEGLYEVLMQSRKPIAKAFKQEVKAILKSIRKHGAYMTMEQIEKVLLSPETIIKLATHLKEEQELRRQAEDAYQRERVHREKAEAQCRQEQTRRMKVEICYANEQERSRQLCRSKQEYKTRYHQSHEETQGLRAKAERVDAIEAWGPTIPIALYSGILWQNGVKIGRNKLFAWFREHGYLHHVGRIKNYPTYKSWQLGLFEVAESTIRPKESGAFKVYTTLMTGKGQMYFLDYFIKSCEQIREAREKNADWDNYTDRLFDPKYADVFNEYEAK